MTHEQEIHMSAASQPTEVAEPGRSLKVGARSCLPATGSRTRDIAELVVETVT